MVWLELEVWRRGESNRMMIEKSFLAAGGSDSSDPPPFLLLIWCECSGFVLFFFLFLVSWFPLISTVCQESVTQLWKRRDDSDVLKPDGKNDDHLFFFFLLLLLSVIHDHEWEGLFLSVFCSLFFLFSSFPWFDPMNLLMKDEAKNESGRGRISDPLLESPNPILLCVWHKREEERKKSGMRKIGYSRWMNESKGVSHQKRGREWETRGWRKVSIG